MDKRQRSIWTENREKLLRAMGDYRSWTVVQLAKKSGLRRGPVYEHLYRLSSGEIVIREGSKWRLNPEWVFDDCKPRWHITGYNMIVLPNGITAEVEMQALEWPSSLKLPAYIKNRLQIKGNMLLGQKLLEKLLPRNYTGSGISENPQNARAFDL